MINVAIVEDEKAAADKLLAYLGEYGKATGNAFATKVYASAEAFLANYSMDTDIVFMDIELEDMNGMDAAVRLRKVDPVVVLIFVTNISGYAIRGYLVSALDYLLKPVGRYAFETMMKRAVSACSKHEGVVNVRTQNGLSCVRVSDIGYVEVSNHRLCYHTDKGCIEAWGTLKETEAALGDGFARCCSSFLVNLRSVAAVEGKDVVLKDGTRLLLSRNYKNKFMEAIARLMSGRRA